VRAGASIWMCIRLVHIRSRKEESSRRREQQLHPLPLPFTLIQSSTRTLNPHTHTTHRSRLSSYCCHAAGCASKAPAKAGSRETERYIIITALFYVAAAATAHPTATIMRTGVLLFTLSAFGALSSSATLCQAAVTAPPSSRYVSECIHPIPCS